ncbi:MAG: T9SS C-terminal target domain-containing protein, partial [Bacteroidetes bacterium]
KTIVTIGTTSGTGTFTTGDRVLIIQMKGATIDDRELATYGSITNYNNAGNFEFTNISSISGSNITLSPALVKNFSTGTNNLTQLVRVPTYTSANVLAAGIQALAWNGTIGGILTLRVTGTLTMNGNITADGLGFRGGVMSTIGGNCSITTYRTNGTFLGYKGEGIAVEPNGNLNGRGALANGGGGGNGHNGGGGGGSNAGQGGTGGREWAGPLFAGWCGVQDGTCNNANNLVGGIGGYVLNFTTSGKYFLGGGGGGAQQDNNVSSNGANGGGMIIIFANTISVNGGVSRTISANGASALDAQYDGAGAGGAGGTILISASNFTGNLNVSANGGNGGNTSACHGPGGGGGGGFIQYTNNITPFSNVSNIATAGLNGTQPVGTTCGDPAVAVGGSFCGTVSPIATGTVLNRTALPVRLISFGGKKQNNYHLLVWQTASEENNSHFTIESSSNGVDFNAIGEVDGSGSFIGLKEYSFKDMTPLVNWNYYRLKQVDFSGEYTYSNIVALKNDINIDINIFPNPTSDGNIQVEIAGENENLKGFWNITDLQGKELIKNQSFEGNNWKINLTELSKGMYIIVIKTQNNIWQKKVILQF